MAADEVSIAFNGGIATPIRFRYKTEGESASGKLYSALPNVAGRAKKGPELKLRSTRGGEFVVYANCITAAEPGIPHSNFLIGGKNHCSDGVFRIDVTCEPKKDCLIELDCGVQGVKKEGFLDRYKQKLSYVQDNFNPLCAVPIPKYTEPKFFDGMNMTKIRVYVSVYRKLPNYSQNSTAHLKFVGNCVSNIVEHSSKKQDDTAPTEDELKIVVLEPSRVCDTGDMMIILFNPINKAETDPAEAAQNPTQNKRKSKQKQLGSEISVRYSNNIEFEHNISVGHWHVEGVVTTNHNGVAVVVQVPSLCTWITKCQAAVASAQQQLVTRAFVSLVFRDKMSEAREIFIYKRESQQIHENAELRRKVPKKNIQHEYPIPRTEGHSGGASPATLQAVQRMAASRSATKFKPAPVQQPSTSRLANNSFIRQNETWSASSASNSCPQAPPSTSVQSEEPQNDILRLTLQKINMQLSDGKDESNESEYFTEAACLSGASEKTLQQLSNGQTYSAHAPGTSDMSAYLEDAQDTPFDDNEDFTSDDDESLMKL